MKFDPQIQQRRSMRLKGYDYGSPGAYFVTLVAYQREQLFGEVVNGKMICSALGEILRQEWMRSIGMRKEIRLFEDEYVVMPNHVHGIVWLVAEDGSIEVGADGVCPVLDSAQPEIRGARRAPQQIAPQRQEVASLAPQQVSPQQIAPQQLQRTARSLGSFIAGFKASVTSRAKRELDMTGIWQRNYYDHIIRNEEEYKRIYAYIESNPENWKDDEENPGRAG